MAVHRKDVVFAQASRVSMEDTTEFKATRKTFQMQGPSFEREDWGESSVTNLPSLIWEQ